MTVTPAQRKALDLLVQDERRQQAQHPDRAYWISPRGLALMMWPDSPAWGKRTRKHGSNDPGAMGGTMPMLGAKVLWALWEQGYVTRRTDSTLFVNLWGLTAAGRDAATEGRS